MTTNPYTIAQPGDARCPAFHARLPASAVRCLRDVHDDDEEHVFDLSEDQFQPALDGDMPRVEGVRYRIQ